MMSDEVISALLPGDKAQFKIEMNIKLEKFAGSIQPGDAPIEIIEDTLCL